jgi:cell division protease FtsH
MPEDNNTKNPPRKPEPGKPGGKQPGPIQPGGNRGFMGLVVVILLVGTLAMFLSSAQTGKVIDYAEFETSYKNGEIKRESVEIKETAVVAVRTQPEVSPNPHLIRVPINTATREIVAGKVYELTQGAVKDRPQPGWVTPLYLFGPLVLLIGLMWFLIARGMRAAGGGAGGMLGNFGKSRHRTLTKEMTGITFSDVAGIDEAKDEVTRSSSSSRTPRSSPSWAGASRAACC